jgi:choline dehydrogenase-like flavoprotein
LFKSKFDWDFSSSQNELTRNREIYLCRGKVLGGSSCTNVLLYHRGDENDYKEWAKSVESSPLAKAWIPENILPYFKKSEDNIQGESKYHGTGGEYSVSDVKYQNPMSKAFLHACAEFGLPSNDDFNAWSRSQEGYGRFQVTQKDGVRSSAASGFLEPVLSRKNLKVRSSTLVRKVIFQNKKAIGVEIEKNGKVEIVNLKEDGEVILTGGAINTPQILLLSGIGDKSQLQELNIPVIHDLPGVGKNLQDHPAAVISYKCLPGNEGIALSSQVKIKGTLLPNPKALIQWLLLRSGPLTSTSCDHGGFFKTNPNLTSPDLQIRFISAKAISPDGMGTLIEVSSS